MLDVPEVPVPALHQLRDELHATEDNHKSSTEHRRRSRILLCTNTLRSLADYQTAIVERHLLNVITTMSQLDNFATSIARLPSLFACKRGQPLAVFLLMA